MSFVTMVDLKNVLDSLADKMKAEKPNLKDRDYAKLAKEQVRVFFYCKLVFMGYGV